MDHRERAGRALVALLAMQRRSWEQGLAGQAFLDLGRFDLATVVAADAMANQLPDGRLADLGDRNVVNGAAALEPVLAVAGRTADEALRAAADRQLRWLLLDAPRATDGTLMHVLDRRQIWSDSVYMVVPTLVAAGRVDEAERQLTGHRRRLEDPATRLFAHIWDEDEQRLARAVKWGGGNGWVVAGCARALHLLRRASPTDPSGLADPVVERFAATAVECGRAVIDACLAHRAESGLFPDIVDDATSFEEVTLVAMLAYGVLAGVADGWLPAAYGAVGRSLLDTAAAHVGDNGLLRPACGSPTFDRPGISAEAQACFLMAVAVSDRSAGDGTRR